MQLSFKIMALHVMYLWYKDVLVCFPQPIVRYVTYVSSADTNIFPYV